MKLRARAGASLLALTLSACAGRAPDARELYRASTKLGDAVKKGERAQLRAGVMPTERDQLDEAEIFGADEDDDAAREHWAKALSEPSSVRPEGWMAITPDRYVGIVWTDDGWRFDTDPYEAYPQGTPREALSSLVRASRAQRWDVLVDLAPRRYRIGLGVDEIEAAWTEGEYAAALAESRDRLAEHLDDPIVSDTHQALLDLGDGHFARLEREGDRWVVVDF